MPLPAKADSSRHNPALGMTDIWMESRSLDFGEFFFQQLFVVEVVVVAVQGEEFFVGAEFDDAAGVQDGDAVGVADGGDAVGNEDGGAAAHYVAQVVEDFVFGVGVDAGEGVVEDEDFGIANEGAGDGGALLLAAGEGDAAFADHGVVAFGEGFDVGGDVGGFGGAADFGVVVR